MSDQLANISVPAYLARQSQALAETTGSLLGGLGSGNFLPKISIRGSRFRIVAGDEEIVLRQGEYALQALNVAIITARPTLSKAYYDSPYDSGADVAVGPRCMSLDGTTPDPSIESPIAPSCAACAFNAFGSAKVGRGKACSDFKRIIVVPVGADGQPITLWGDAVQAFRMDVPAASLKNFRAYVSNMTRRNLPVPMAITTITFQEAEFPLIDFSFSGFVSQDTADLLEKMIEDPMVQSEIATVAAAATQLPAPAPAPVAPAPAPVAPAPAPGTAQAPADLQSMPLKELRALATSLGVENANKRRRSTLVPMVAQLLEKREVPQLSLGVPEPTEPTEPAPAPVAPAPAVADDSAVTGTPSLEAKLNNLLGGEW